MGANKRRHNKGERNKKKKNNDGFGQKNSGGDYFLKFFYVFWIVGEAS